MKKLIFLLGCISAFNSHAQFHPPAGQPGTSAIYKDSSIIVAWATTCTVVRGYMDITNQAGGVATAGVDANGTGVADGSTIVSLGDGGMATLTFPSTLFDGPGYDFAIFENSFDGIFLELAFVEVSSDGINFFRFSATSNTSDSVQTGSFDSTDASKLNNLAGKYKANYGTPFDLYELNGTTGLDIAHISHVRVADVVGNIQPPYATYDNWGTPVNDPWPTAFASGGFDLDGAAAIHMNAVNVHEENISNWNIYPQPASSEIFINGNSDSELQVKLFDASGKHISVSTTWQHYTTHVSWNKIPAGMYILHITNEKQTAAYRILVQ